MTESRRTVAGRLAKMSWYYTREYLKAMENKEKEDQAVKAIEEGKSEEPVCLVLTAEHDMELFLTCMKDMTEAIQILTNEDEDVDEWMVAGINAMIDKANEMEIVPFDLPVSICGLLCAGYRK